MTEMAVLLIVVLLVAASRYGTDSRDGRDWSSSPPEPRHSPPEPVVPAGPTPRADVMLAVAGLARTVRGASAGRRHRHAPAGGC